MSPAKRKKKASESRYLNRELSWLAFNERVLEEAANSSNPLLERLKFLAIFESNLDEFYMVRVSGLIEQFEAGALSISPDGLTPNDQLEEIGRKVQPLRQRAADHFKKKLIPLLSKNAIHLREFIELRPEKQAELRTQFARDIFPLCTPLALSPANSVPFISNRSLNIVVDLIDENGETKLARLKIPTVIRRTIRLSPGRHDYILLEDLILHNLEAFFPGVKIRGAHIFRVVRDAEIELQEVKDSNVIRMIEETIRLRKFGDPVLLQVQPSMPVRIREELLSILELDPTDAIEIDGVLDMNLFWELARIDKPALRFKTHIPNLPLQLSTAAQIFETVSQQDVLLHHPFDSFRTVEALVEASASDPQVLGIKQTLYRVGPESPIVDSLLDAAEAGKQVTALVELKARFEESNNIGWARTLERAGVHVTYGFREIKTHAKLCQVIRQEPDRLRSYSHVGTGNYNPQTSRTYTDLSLLTCDPDIAQDIAELFNHLTGFSNQADYRKLLVAPGGIREGILSRIEREAEFARAGKPARIIWKLNSLVDPQIIEALYAASNSGVVIDLIVRGICCLRPGVKKLSEKVRVISIIGRFLEHSRIYAFNNGGTPDVLMGSADMMRRNLDRRVEVITPIEDPRLQDQILKEILSAYLRDTRGAWLLSSDGSYARVSKKKTGLFSAQDWLMLQPHALESEAISIDTAKIARNMKS